MFCRSEERILEGQSGLIEAIDPGRLTGPALPDPCGGILRLKERHLTRRRARFSEGRLARARLPLRVPGGVREGGGRSDGAP